MAKPTEISPRRARWSFPLALALLAAGCAPPQVEPGHRELVLRLATGASTRDPAIIDRAADEIASLAASGRLSEPEREFFRSIVDSCRAGNWDHGRDLAYRLRDAQRPTAEDLDRVNRREMPTPKKLSGSP